MARIPPATRESVPQDQWDAFDNFLRKRGEIPGGPLSIMINAPEIAKRGDHLSEYLRLESSLTAKVLELAMLVTAREMDCQYIWNAHATKGRKEGLPDILVDHLRDRKALSGMSPDEEAVVDYGRELFRTRRVSQPAFDAALAQFGVRGLTELTSLMGYYAMLAFNVNAFKEELPAELTEPVLPV